MYNQHNQKSFSLLDLLIIIAIICIIAAILFVSIDPMEKFKAVRDGRRASDIAELIHAINRNKIDHGGIYASAIANLKSGEVYMIGLDKSGCTRPVCEVPVTVDACVDLKSGVDNLVAGGYLKDIPVSPKNGNIIWSVAKTGYTIEKSSDGLIYIRACQTESGKPIEVSL